MRVRRGGWGAAIVAAACVLLGGAAQRGEERPHDLARQAVSTDPAEADTARARLRAAGPDGLDVLFEVHAASLSREDSVDDGGLRVRVHAAADAVAGQRHAASSRLYWYTDLEQAKAAARKAGRPILSLRLLGRLDEQFSCANSRFFRTVLYANHEIADLLRSRFVLHWSSERPAPRVTIDFGGGRRLESTLTGNSIHYVLDAEGRPVDALPGLYGPRAFQRGLTRAAAAAAVADAQQGSERDASLRRYHQQRLRELAQSWRSGVEGVGLSAPVPWEGASVRLAKNRPLALTADQLAMTKSLVERPVLTGLYGPAAGFPPPDAELWRVLADLAAEDAVLDEGALRRMREDGIDPDASPATIDAFERSIAVDTVRNEYSLHSRLHLWFSRGAAALDLDALNARVYAELFLTPRNDPWLGLVSPGTYSALGASAWAGR